MDRLGAARPAVIVVAGVIECDGTVLLARRKVGGPHGALWEFPGGKLEAGETPEQALARELMEEFGITTEIGGFIAASVHSYAHISVDLRAYAVRVLGGAFQLTDHDAVRWVPLGELGRYGMPAADVPIAQALLRRQRDGTA
jgi:mutator protein MutT